MKNATQPTISHITTSRPSAQPHEAKPESAGTRDSTEGTGEDVAHSALPALAKGIAAGTPDDQSPPEAKAHAKDGDDGEYPAEYGKKPFHHSVFSAWPSRQTTLGDEPELHVPARAPES
jgi:hypothetical protein